MNLTTREDRPTAALLLGHDEPVRFVADRASWWDRMRARLHAGALDEQLAGGASPDDGGLRAVRAAMLVAPDTRRRLALDWEALVERARGPQVVGDPRVPVPRRRILAVEHEIRAVAAALRAGGPVSAGGVAQAYLLLTDGTGPIYRRRATAADLRAAVQAVERALDPSIGLLVGPRPA